MRLCLMDLDLLDMRMVLKNKDALPCGAPFNKVKSLVVLSEPRSSFARYTPDANMIKLIYYYL